MIRAPLPPAFDDAWRDACLAAMPEEDHPLILAIADIAKRKGSVDSDDLEDYLGMPRGSLRLDTPAGDGLKADYEKSQRDLMRSRLRVVPRPPDDSA